MQNKYVAYYRVSTKEQGVSGLGLESQRDAVEKYVSGVDGVIIESYTEVESGKKKDRTVLTAAIQHALREGAVLVVKKLDRLSRGGLHILIKMEELGVRFVESDSPNDNDLIRGIKLTFAKEEAKAISDRTKAALRVIKDKIDAEGGYVSKSGNIVKSLGNPQNLTRKAVDKSVAVRKKAAQNNPDNMKAGAFIVALASTGMNWAVITKKLNDAGFVTSKGNSFFPAQTKRLYERYAECTMITGS